MVYGLESLTSITQTATDTSTLGGAAIPIWLVGVVVAPLAGAVAYQTRRILDLTKRIEELTDRYLDHYEGGHHEKGA